MLVPLGRKILVKQQELEKVSKGGIILEYENEKLEKAGITVGEIVAQGPYCWKTYSTVDREGIVRDGEPQTQVGDQVYFAKHAGAFITDPVTNEEFVLIFEDDIHCVIREEQDG